jgi:Protein of unknown function (DUF3096)
VAIPPFLDHHVTEPVGAVRCLFSSTCERRSFMTISLVQLQPIIALLAGILILLMPRLLNYIVAIYLIVVGVTGLIR